MMKGGGAGGIWLAEGAGEAGDEGADAEAVAARPGAAVSVVAGEGVAVIALAAFAVTLGSRQPANKSSNGARSVSTSSNTATT